MANMNYAKMIQRIAMSNINEGYDVGDRTLFGFSVDSSFFEEPYELETIVQVDVFDKEDNPAIYLLPYYWTDKKNGICDHDDLCFSELSEDEKRRLYETFKNTFEPMSTPQTTPIHLSSFLKKGMSLEEKVKLINAWEEDRGSDGEWVYDLDDDEDSMAWIGLYGVPALYECRAIGRYWMGGWQFKFKDKNTEGNLNECWNVSNESADNTLSDCNILSDIYDRYTEYLERNKKYQSNEKTIEWVTEIYKGLIDFRGFAIAKGDIAYCQYAWITKSNDGAYEDYAVGFNSKEECYTSMRNAVLEKMKWNTEYADVIDGQGEEGSYSIGYEVHFNPNSIEHISYSGRYIALIVRCNADGDLEPNAWNNLDTLLKITK